MNKFWEWMAEKGYGALRDFGLSNEAGDVVLQGILRLSDAEDESEIFPSENMLIGYMLEYLYLHVRFEEIEEKLDYVAAHSNIYEQLEKIIEELDS